MKSVILASFSLFCYSLLLREFERYHIFLVPILVPYANFTWYHYVYLTPDGDSTIVRLRHSGLKGDLRDMHAMGWEHYMARLVVAAAGGDPGPDPWAQGDNSDQKR